MNDANPAAPHAYARRILLAVTGLSPQIITETIYALAIAPKKPRELWVPTEIHVITTATGARHARLNLLAEKTGRFHSLRADYRLPDIAFPTENIHILAGAEGHTLDDIRSSEENEHAADFITDIVRRLTESDASALHVSIAGGRKTMGYYLGYALSLYGRSQDRLSHVLVTEPFESNRDFYYPTPYEYPIHVRRNDKEISYDAREAKVDLAEIPFVRMREDLPKALLAGRTRFSQAVAEAQKTQPPVALSLDPVTRTVTAGGESFTLKPAEFSFYWMLAERARCVKPGLHWSEPVAHELLTYLGKLINPHSGDYVKAEKAYRSYTKDNFDPAKAHVNRSIKKALGDRRAQPYLISLQETIPGARYRRSGLNLHAAAIVIGQAWLPGQQESQKQGGNCRREIKR